jgi:hypothetical protein
MSCARILTVERRAQARSLLLPVAPERRGILITPFDPDFADAMVAYDEAAKKYRNALRELAK